MKANPYLEACQIQEGAVNISAIARALVRAADSARETGDASENSAVRLIVHQLAHLCCVDAINHELTLYSELLADAESRAFYIRTNEEVA